MSLLRNSPRFPVSVHAPSWQNSALRPSVVRERIAAPSRVAARLADLSQAQLAEIAVHGCERSPELKNKADALIAKVARSTSRSRVSRSRLAKFSHAQLVEIAAAGCDASTEVKNRADALLAAHKPLAQWAVEGVLLSSDLVPHLLAPLQLEDGAAAAVCSLWAEGWKATSEGRRRLRKVALDFPQDLLSKRSLDMAVVPGGDAQLVVRSGTTVRILGRDMSSSSSFQQLSIYGCIAASEEFIYTIHDFGHITSHTHDGTEVVFAYEDPDKVFNSFALAPGGLLFCLLYEEGDDEQDEIVALDAQTLQPRHRFGLSLLNGAGEMVVVGEELFVCDTGNDRLQVFSLAGEHRRSITGEWKRPLALCFVKDRLYLLEQCDDDEDEEGNFIYPQPGRRIFVLFLQGDTLQVYTHPVEGQAFSDGLCCFDGKLLAPVRDRRSRIVKEVVALCGV